MVVVLRDAIATADETNDLIPWTMAARRRLGELVADDKGAPR